MSLWTVWRHSSWVSSFHICITICISYMEWFYSILYIFVVMFSHLMFTLCWLPWQVNFLLLSFTLQLLVLYVNGTSYAIRAFAKSYNETHYGSVNTVTSSSAPSVRVHVRANFLSTDALAAEAHPLRSRRSVSLKARSSNSPRLEKRLVPACPVTSFLSLLTTIKIVRW